MTFKKKHFNFCIIFLIFFIFGSNKILMPKNNFNVDPFSKINIKSQNAVCQKNKDKPQTYFFTYQENVLVTFADNSTINSEILQIELDTSDFSKLTNNNKPKSEKGNQDFSSVIKKIKFKNNVKLQNTNKTIEANVALVDLEKKNCYLSGNVKIEQKRIKQNNSKDLPLTTYCNKACLNLETEKITLIGNTKKPVNTTIEIEKKSMRLKKKKKRLI